MRVVITHRPTEQLDEAETRGLRPGRMYDLPAIVASTLIVDGCAEPDRRRPEDERAADRHSRDRRQHRF